MTPEERYAQLLPVVERLFVERGYAAVSMEDIAREAGVSRPVVYDHFGTKERAFIACVDRARADYESELLGGVDPGRSLREQLRAGGEAFFAMLERDPARWRLLFATTGLVGGEGADRLAELRFRTIDRIAGIIRAMAPKADEDLIQAHAQVISGAGERLGHWWLTRPDLSREQIVEFYIEACWDGTRRLVD